MRYWDTSALVPLFTDERAAGGCRNLIRADPVVATWALTPLEIYSAASRKLREGKLSRETLDRIDFNVRAFMDQCRVIEDAPAVRDTARRVLRSHDLGTADALQLAAAISWCEGKPKRRMFVASDVRLLRAAGAEGFDPMKPATV